MKSADNSFAVDKTEDSSGFLLWQVTNLWQREIRKTLEPLGLTHSQFVLMASIHWLTLHKQEVTQVLLSNSTKIDPMTTSTVLRTLQAKGFLDRQQHLTDTRAKTITLTGSGVKIIKQAVKKVEAFDQSFFSALGVGTSSFNRQLLALLSQAGLESKK